jgi:hypothetical protein
MLALGYCQERLPLPVGKFISLIRGAGSAALFCKWHTFEGEGPSNAGNADVPVRTAGSLLASVTVVPRFDTHRGRRRPRSQQLADAERTSTLFFD